MRATLVGDVVRFKPFLRRPTDVPVSQIRSIIAHNFSWSDEDGEYSSAEYVFETMGGRQFYVGHSREHSDLAGLLWQTYPHIAGGSNA